MEGTNIVQKFVEIFPPVTSALFTGREAWEVKGLVARPGSQGRDDDVSSGCHKKHYFRHSKHHIPSRHKITVQRLCPALQRGQFPNKLS